MTSSNPYAQRRLLRSLEKNWARLETLLNRFLTSNFNPLYHLGTLSIFLTIILLVTGLYLTIFYRPGVDRAFLTVELISATWLGSLMRSMHKYASDALIFVVVLHILKMLFSDRFWGARWLAWTSGWIMLAIIWLVGTMGYWLVWDQRAQWLTELMMETSRGASALTYLAPDLVSTTFSNFVIILFLHVFIPLLGFLGIYIHVLRLSRAQWWAPRWMMLQAALGLILLAVIKPVASAMPADLSQIIASTPLDSLYLGFLPLVDQWGNLVVGGLSILIFGSFVLLPWLWRGENLGPALVADEKCTGCTLCFSECPYDAIRMLPRHDDAGYEKLAVINSAQCTGCGVCVGACPDEAMSLTGLAVADVISDLKDVLAVQKDGPATVLFVGQRETALGSLPPAIQSGADHSVISVTSWGVGNPGRVVTVRLPSTGAVHIEWVRDLRDAGADYIVILTSPYDDGIYREDPHWVYSRLQRRPALIKLGLHWLELSPGDQGPVASLLDVFHAGESSSDVSRSDLPQTQKRARLRPPLKAALLGGLMLTLLFALTLLVDIPAGKRSVNMAAVRLALDARGVISQANIPENVELPEGADLQEIFGGRHYPISLRVFLDDQVLLDETYQPAGISRDGRISAGEYLTLPPGEHQVQIYFRDDNQDFRLLFDSVVEFPMGRVLLFEYNEGRDVFTLRE